MTRSPRPGDLQLAILHVLWRAGEATVAEVKAALESERPRALTTIATMLAKMEGKSLVEHRVDGRQFVYRARVSEDEVRRSMVSDLTEKLFAGDARALVSHLVREQDVDAAELSELARRIDESGDDDAELGEDAP